jgi:hypothetical protein
MAYKPLNDYEGLLNICQEVTVAGDINTLAWWQAARTAILSLAHMSREVVVCDRVIAAKGG